MNLISYINIDPKYRPLITTDIMLAKQGCRRCHGRGHVGYNVARNSHIPCGCVVVDMDKLAEVLKAGAERGEARAKLVREIETNIPTLLDQPNLEAPSGNES